MATKFTKIRCRYVFHPRGGPEESRIPLPPCAPLNTPLRSQVILYCNRLTTWGSKKAALSSYSYKTDIAIAVAAIATLPDYTPVSSIHGVPSVKVMEFCHVNISDCKSNRISAQNVSASMSIFGNLCLLLTRA